MNWINWHAIVEALTIALIWAIIVWTYARARNSRRKQQIRRAVKVARTVGYGTELGFSMSISNDTDVDVFVRDARLVADADGKESISLAYVPNFGKAVQPMSLADAARIEQRHILLLPKCGGPWGIGPGGMRYPALKTFKPIGVHAVLEYRDILGNVIVEDVREHFEPDVKKWVEEIFAKAASDSQSASVAQG